MVLVSPHRAKRPWQGQQEAPACQAPPSHDSSCYLCAGNKRITGDINPDYSGTYVFDNDFPAIQADAVDLNLPEDPLLVARAIKGVARVICFSPDHSKSLPQLTEPAIESVIDTWIDQLRDLGQ